MVSLHVAAIWHCLIKIITSNCTLGTHFAGVPNGITMRSKSYGVITITEDEVPQSLLTAAVVGTHVSGVLLGFAS